MALMQPEIPVRRSQLLIATAMAVYSAAVQLGVALGTVTFVAVTGWERLLGAAPALMLGGAGSRPGPAGRAMDRLGRMPVVATGFVAGAVGACVVALAIHLDSPGLVVLGLLLVGCANGTIQLLRTAGGDLVPASRRARGSRSSSSARSSARCSGRSSTSPCSARTTTGRTASCSPAPLRRNHRRSGSRSASPSARIRARSRSSLRAAVPTTSRPSLRPCARSSRRPGVLVAMGGALTSFAVMVAVMNLTGYVVVSVHGHAQSAAFPIIPAHIFGMYALVLVVGNIADKAGAEGRPSSAGSC